MQFCTPSPILTGLRTVQEIQRRIEARVDRLGLMLDRFSHTHLTGMDCYRLRVGDYRVVYDFDRPKGVLCLLAVGHRREVYRK